jgi:phosphoenolpyruvate carboxykinase (GTP)
MGRNVLDKIGSSDNFVKGMHSVGDFDPNRRFIMHFPQDSLVWSIGSGYGGNALLGKKCFALRIASCLGRREGWLAEHMVVMGIQDPKADPISRRPFPCRSKTNLLTRSALPGTRSGRSATTSPG